MRFSITWLEFALCCTLFILTGGVIGKHIGKVEVERRIFFNEIQGKNTRLDNGSYRCVATW